jgi:hypothetical protein
VPVNGPCAAAALDAWFAHHRAEEGAPLFRSFSSRGELRDVRIDGRVVADVVKRLFRDASASPSEVENIAAHSLRRGFVTSADMAGATTATTPKIMHITGHRDVIRGGPSYSRPKSASPKRRSATRMQ